MNHHPRAEPNNYVPILIPRGMDWFCLADVGRFSKATKCPTPVDMEALAARYQNEDFWRRSMTEEDDESSE